jgi:hypothetical protein
MNTKFVLPRSIAVLAIAFALGSSALSTNVFAAGRVAPLANAHPQRPRWGERHQWDPWGHWGAYYGPMVHAP